MTEFTSTRTATHAGSWYSSSSSKLNRELDDWLSAVKNSNQSGVSALPKVGCKAIIAPHAGYSYSGANAAFAYSCIDTEAIDRVFILGPSHHHYLDGCALSRCKEYSTPLGALPLDIQTIEELHATGKFEYMDSIVDEEEHSIEMHLPYIKKIFDKKSIKIVPILIGSISYSSEKTFGALLSTYLASPSTLFIVSSDFCHWGTRFGYTYYQPPHQSTSSLSGFVLDRSTIQSVTTSHPVWKAIELLDHNAMDIIAFDSNDSSSRSAKIAHLEFKDYLRETKNTICGRHPIGVLLGAVSAQEESAAGSSEGRRLVWVKYDQSGKVQGLKDSSVSYASAYFVE